MIGKNRERANVHIAWNTTFHTTHFAPGSSCKFLHPSNLCPSKFRKQQPRHLPPCTLRITLRWRYMSTYKLPTCNNLLYANNISGHYTLSPVCRCDRYAQRIQQFVRLGANAFSQHGIEWRCIYIYQSPAQPHQTFAMERGTYEVPVHNSQTTAINLSAQQLQFILEGIMLSSIKKRKRYEHAIVDKS